jgi:hypothetical protein
MRDNYRDEDPETAPEKLRAERSFAAACSVGRTTRRTLDPLLSSANAGPRRRVAQMIRRWRRSASRARSRLLARAFVLIELVSRDETIRRGKAIRKLTSWLAFPQRRLRHLVPAKLRRLATQLQSFIHLAAMARQRDATLSALHTPPADAHVSLTRVWLVEMLTSSTVDTALRALRRGRLGLEQRELDEWVMDIRGRAPFEGSRGIGTFTRAGPVGQFDKMVGKARDLPPQFSRVGLRIVSVTRTINAVIAEFTLTADAAGTIETLLRAPTHDRITREHGGAIGTTFAESVKAEQVLMWRDQLHREAHRWLTRQVPGIFSNRSTRDAVPTAELVVVDGEMPLQGRFLIPSARWLHACDLDGVMSEVWICTDPIGLRAKVPLGFEEPRVRHNLVLAAARRHLPADSTIAPTGSQSDLPDALRDVEWDGLLAAWGLRSLVEVWEAQGSLSRDLSSRRWGRWRTIRALNGLQVYLKTVAIDVAISADELRDLVTEHSTRFEWQFPSFLQQSDGPPSAVTTLAASMRVEYSERVAKLERLIGRLSDTLETIGSVTAAAAGVRLQRRALYIAAMAVAIAIVGLVIALHSHN